MDQSTDQMLARLPERLSTKISVDRDTGCWVWTAAKHQGYGQVKWDGRAQRAHRVVRELLVGPISSDLVSDHLCRNRACVNPDHIEPVTSGENVLRGIGVSAANAAKTHCAAGHLLDGENLKVRQRPNGRVSRCCRQCERAHEEARKSRRRAAGGGLPNAEKTHCPQGHIYDEVNTYTYVTSSGMRQRFCRSCLRSRNLTPRSTR